MSAGANNEGAQVNPEDLANSTAAGRQMELQRESKLKFEGKSVCKTQVDPSNASVGDEDEELDMSFGESSASSHDSDEYVGQQASEVTLRQLKLSALEDVLVCGQNRESTESARRLFAALSAVNENGQKPDIKIPSVARRNANATIQGGSSLSSNSSCCDDEKENERNNNSSRTDHPNEKVDYFEDLLSLRSPCSLGRASPQAIEDSGTIKLDRRCCSSSSSSSGNFGRTLVCSVSPTSQMRTSPPGSLVRSSLSFETGANIDGYEDDSYTYSIDRDEIRQCRAAFRENRLIIKRVQDEAFKRLQQGQPPGLKRSSSQGPFRDEEKDQRVGDLDKSRWANSLGRRLRSPGCARCGLKLYPLDRMELDFTRTTLNIHRNCFRCQLCATLLRLETYASIDGNLYCPAHIRCVLLSA